MEKIKQLVGSLSAKEYEFICHVLRYKNGSVESKRLQLLNIIWKNPKISEGEVHSLLYKEFNGSAFAQLKGKLIDAILDLLLYKTDKRSFASELTVSRFSCRKLLAYEAILDSRNCNGLRSHFFKKGMKLAQSFNYWLEAMLFANALMIRDARSKSINEYESYLDLINELKGNFGHELALIDGYYRIGLPNDFKTNKSEKYERFAARILSAIEAIELAESNVNGLYYLLLARIVYYNFIRDFDQSLNWSTEILRLAKTHKAVGSKTHLAVAYMYVAESYVRLQIYDEATKCTIQALSFFRKDSANELRALEILFLAHLRGNDGSKTVDVIARVFNHPRLVENPFLKAKWLYFKANLLYLKGDMDDALEALYEDRTLMKDTSGWLLGYKLLELMIKIEEGDYYIVGVLLAAFKQLLYRIKKEKTHRAKVIFYILRNLLKYGGDFKTAHAQKGVKEKMQLLQEGKEDMYWNPLGFELIPFHEWFMHKTQSQKRYTFYG